MTRAYVGLGANLGDPEGALVRAVAALAALPRTRVAGVSRLYATRPVGVTDQPDFRNAVAALDVPPGPDPAAGAIELLVRLKEIERAAGRRARGRWGPREIDLDLLAFGRHRLAVVRPPEGTPLHGPKGVPLLVVPHLSARERLFVLAPWADLAPRLSPPGWGETVETARRRQERAEGEDAVRAIGDWDAAARRWRTIRAR